MAPHSSTLAWRIPWTEEPGRLQSMGSLRVRHDRATSLSLFTFMHWRRKWQPTPVFLPGESQGRGSLVGCRLWGHTRVGYNWSDLAAVAAAMSFSSFELCSSVVRFTCGKLILLFLLHRYVFISDIFLPATAGIGKYYWFLICILIFWLPRWR